MLSAPSTKIYTSVLMVLGENSSILILEETCCVNNFFIVIKTRDESYKLKHLTLMANIVNFTLHSEE